MDSDNYYMNLSYIHTKCNDDYQAFEQWMFMPIEQDKVVCEDATDDERKLAAEFTEYETHKGFDWNDIGKTDFESAINAFLEIKRGDVTNEVRYCSECGLPFNAGYCENGGDAYYCSDHCLHKHFSPEEWENECYVNEQSYYTEW